MSHSSGDLGGQYAMPWAASSLDEAVNPTPDLVPRRPPTLSKPRPAIFGTTKHQVARRVFAVAPSTSAGTWSLSFPELPRLSVSQD